MMQRMAMKKWGLIGLSVTALLVGCQSLNDLTPGVNQSLTAGAARTAAVSLSEGFEVGSSSPKTAYDVSPTGSASGDNVTLPSGSWNMYDALVGNLSGDLKAGSWSGRIRNTGKVTMLFDVTSGISTVTVKHGTYSGDAASQWGLWYSTNGGSNWTQLGSAVTTGSSLQTQTFTLNLSGSVRLEIRKLSGGSSRINIDDIAINDNSGGGTTPLLSLMAMSAEEKAIS